MLCPWGCVRAFTSRRALVSLLTQLPQGHSARHIASRLFETSSTTNCQRPRGSDVRMNGEWGSRTKTDPETPGKFDDHTPPPLYSDPVNYKIRQTPSELRTPFGHRPSLALSTCGIYIPQSELGLDPFQRSFVPQSSTSPPPFCSSLVHLSVQRVLAAKRARLPPAALSVGNFQFAVQHGRGERALPLYSSPTNPPTRRR